MSSNTLGRFCLLSNNGHQISGTLTPLFLFKPGLAHLSIYLVVFCPWVNLNIPKDKTPLDMTPGMIYHLKCRDYNDHYIGKSSRCIHTRIEEHRDSIRLDRPDSSAVASHVQDTIHSIDLNGASIIIKDQNTFTQKFKEAILIKAANPGLNRNRCVEVPDIWWPLLLKRQNLLRVSEDIGIQSIDTTDRFGPFTSVRDLRMRGRSS